MALSDLKIKLSYTSQGEDDILKDFLIPALKEATLYKRSVGFFSSSVFELLGEGLDSLVKNDGEIRIICSPELSKEDIEGIQLGYALKEGILRKLKDNHIGCFTPLANTDASPERLDLPRNIITAEKISDEFVECIIELQNKLY